MLNGLDEIAEVYFYASSSI